MKHIRHFSDLSVQCLLSTNMESLNVASVLDDSDFEMLCILVARENLSSDDSDFEDGEDSIPGEVDTVVVPGGAAAVVDLDGALVPCCACCPLLKDNPVASWLWGWRNYHSDEGQL
jgi:hypothetical protein